MNTNDNLVSIMIPTYNQEDYIGEAVESALRQDYSNLVVVVTDDCSTDKTGEIAIKYIPDHRFKYVKNAVHPTFRVIRAS